MGQWRTCQRCNGKKVLPTDPRQPCPACHGEGRISPRRINSVVEPK